MMEIKTTDYISKQSTLLITMAEKNLAGQGQNDFLQDLVNKKWVSVDSELEWLKALHKRVREERETHAGLGWLDVRIKDHIRELESKEKGC